MNSPPDPDAPVPFADDSKGDAVLRDLFTAARRDLPPVDAPRIAARALAPSALAPSVLPKLLGGAALVSVVVAALAWPAPVAPVPSRPPRAPAPVIEAPFVPPPAATLPAPAEPHGAEVPAPLAPARVERERAAPAPNEGAILLRARRALAADDVEAALAAVGEHEAHFSRGPLAPEREAIAIEALSRAGRATEASRRAERFLARWPDSAYADGARRAVTP